MILDADTTAMKRGEALQVIAFAWAVILSLALIASLTPAQAQVRNENKEVQTLKVRIITHRDRGAGTDNGVYFDIGPLAWKLNHRWQNDFEAGSDDTYSLNFPKGLAIDDILWIRLHKKGVGGVTGTRDGLDGAWHPKTLILLVNGAEFKTVQVSTSLNSRCWYWRSLWVDYSDLTLFVRSLRIERNKRLNFFDKALGILTTPLFKKQGISGWLPSPDEKECVDQNSDQLPLSPVCATGEVVANANSTDGLQTVDLKLTQIEYCATDNRICSKSVVVDPAHGFKLPRYIRIENKYAHERIRARSVARICGNLKWDTDREGWWEIHPRSADDLPVERSVSK